MIHDLAIRTNLIPFVERVLFKISNLITSCSEARTCVFPIRANIDLRRAAVVFVIRTSIAY